MGENRLRKEEIPTSSILYHEMYCDYKMQVVRDHTDNERVKSSVNEFAKYLFNTYSSTGNSAPITETTFFPSIKGLGLGAERT